jgi:hypothetical protein
MSRTGVLVRTHRPSVESSDHVLHAVERHRCGFVVTGEIVLDRDAESRALVCE